MTESRVWCIVGKVVDMCVVAGAVLHGHDTGLVSTDYVIGNITYRDHLYSCLDAEGLLHLRFFARPDTSCAWKELAELRRQQGASQVDAFLRQHLSLVVDDPDSEAPPSPLLQSPRTPKRRVVNATNVIKHTCSQGQRMSWLRGRGLCSLAPRGGGLNAADIICPQTTCANQFAALISTTTFTPPVCANLYYATLVAA
ncbi:hypothetical protein PR048_015365 [Dryococelus australis]|uniref:Uncharacterized protein n=1 Tax=Dryococelus australis TaxID=614101 RepID=A0ABQ9HHA0_9NEOP|nr:hypothetical protein PR048_015365 [Dryococelus australis]